MYLRQEGVIARLGALLKNVPDYYNDAQKELIAYSEQLQKTGVVADDVTQAGISQLATFKLSVDNIKKLVPALQDVIVAQYGVNATQESAIASANMLGKVFAGQIGMLSRVGISMTDAQKSLLKTGDQTEQTAMLVNILKDNFGGLNQEMAKSELGEQAQATMAWGDSMESVGKEFYKASGLNEAMKDMTEFFQSKHGEEAAKNLGTVFGTMFGKLASGLTKVATVFGLLKSDIQKTMDLLSDKSKEAAKELRGLVQERKDLLALQKERRVGGKDLTPGEAARLDVVREDITEKDAKQKRRLDRMIKVSDELTEKAQQPGLKTAADIARKVPIVGEAGEGIGNVISSGIDPILSGIVALKGWFNDATITMGEMTETIKIQSDEIKDQAAELKTLQDRP